MNNENNADRKAPSLSLIPTIAEGGKKTYLIKVEGGVMSVSPDKVTEADYFLEQLQDAIGNIRSLRSITDPDTPLRKVIKGCKDK